MSKKIAGLHLWEVRCPVGVLLITTSRNSVEIATRKATRVLKSQEWKRIHIESVSHRGTLDA